MAAYLYEVRLTSYLGTRPGPRRPLVNLPYVPDLTRR